MDLQNTTFSRIKVDALDSRAGAVLDKLQQVGLFRALVIESKAGKVLLDTAFGQLRGTAPNQLSKGDEIYARLLPGKSIPTIKIEQVHSARLELPAKIMAQLEQIIAGSTGSQIIKVLSQSSNQTLIGYASRTFALSGQAQLQDGDTLLLSRSAEQKLELMRLQPESVLKNALSRLLPQNVATQESSALMKLQQQLQSVLQLKPADLARLISGDQPAAHNTAPHSTQSELSVKQLMTLLIKLSSPLANLKNLNADGLRQVFTLLSLLKPAAQNSATLPQILSRLHQTLNQSSDSFTQLLRQIVESNSTTAKTRLPDQLFIEASGVLKAEIQQQIEQTLGQLLIQKTSLRLQQEQNAPIQFNLNLPIQHDNKTSILKLKIKQRNSHPLSDEQHWEINLSFEFGMLGLISTHLLLQETTLSAHFWASKPDTKQLIDTQMDQFKQQLRNSGFKLGLFDCFIGKPQDTNESPAFLRDNLVDIEV
jgi:hypothetical protein